MPRYKYIGEPRVLAMDASLSELQWLNTGMCGIETTVLSPYASVQIWRRMQLIHEDNHLYLILVARVTKPNTSSPSKDSGQDTHTPRYTLNYLKILF